MKAIVLAGGHATRLWPVTKDRAKPLLPLGEKPIIEYIVDDLEKEVDEVIISTNEKFGHDFKQYINDYGRDDTRVVIESQGTEEEKPGTIGAIINLIDQEEIDDDLVIIGGDNYYSFDTSEFMNFCRENNGPANVVYDVKDFEMASSFGIVDVEEDRITGFKEKPDEPPSTLASTACYYFPQSQVSLFHEYEEYFSETSIPADQYLDEPGRLIEWAHEQTEMYAFSFDGHWFDIGTPKGYLNAMEEVVDGNMIKGETDNCQIGENVYVMNGARLENVSIENSIVFHDVLMQESDVRNSLVDKNSEIVDADLNGAIIGEHTTL